MTVTRHGEALQGQQTVRGKVDDDPTANDLNNYLLDVVVSQVLAPVSH